ncbi:MAG TPA: hypothetical protein VKN18_22865 [Blastocatellia bacterium]|nr:hypothetical protein [Blastocatellia bacterium]
MTKVYRVIASTLTLIFALSSPASAWNTRGHMMVAAVAYSPGLTAFTITVTKTEETLRIQL